MEYRGIILLVFGASLIMSPIAVLRMQDSMAAPAPPQQITTENAARAQCDARALETTTYRIGCQNNTPQVSVRREMPGGAVFVSASR
ncbi:MAG: hypothetical protein JJT81_14350 [Rubellimicrobium sp.]|nr:hypothetical protein [Rubellimicrobium sp.]